MFEVLQRALLKLIKNKLDNPFVLALVTIGNIGSSFIIQLLMFSVIGANKNTDIFIIASAVPLVFSSVFSGILNNILVPFFSSKRGSNDRVLLSDVFKIVSLLAFFLGLLLYISSIFWLELTFIPETQEELDSASSIFLVQVVSMFFAIIYSVVWAYLNAQGLHFKSEGTPFFIGVLLIPLAYFALLDYGVIAIAYIITIKTIFCLIVQGAWVLKFDTLKINREVFYTLISKIKPMFLGAMYFKSDYFIERFLMATAPAGMLSLFNLSQQLINAGLQVVTKAIITPNIKLLGSAFREGRDSYEHFFYKKLKLLLVCLTALSLPFILFPEIFKILFYFSDELKANYYELWVFFSFMLGGFISNSIAALINGSFYIHGDTKTPSKLSAVIYTFYMPLKVWSFYDFGMLAMVVVSVCHAVVNTLFLLLFHKKRFLN